MKTTLLIAVMALILPTLGYSQGCEEESPLSNLKCENALYTMRISTTADLTPTLSLKAKSTGILSALARRVVGVEMSNPMTGELRIEASTPCKSSESSGRLFLVNCVKSVSSTAVNFIDENGAVYPWTKGPAIFFETTQKRNESARGVENTVELKVDFYKYASEVVAFDISECQSF